MDLPLPQAHTAVLQQLSIQRTISQASTNCRPVALTSHLTKVLERFLLAHLSKLSNPLSSVGVAPSEPGT